METIHHQSKGEPRRPPDRSPEFVKKSIRAPQANHRLYCSVHILRDIRPLCRILVFPDAAGAAPLVGTSIAEMSMLMPRRILLLIVYEVDSMKELVEGC